MAELKTIKNGDCLEVTGKYIQRDGYTMHKVNNVRDISYRHVYRAVNGEIPEGMIVRHTCDNPLCVNPDHLIIGTVQDNVNDRVLRGRSAIGSKNGRSVLTEEQVLEIRSVYNETNYRIAKRFGVNETTIRDIRKRKTWKHI